MSQSMVYTKKKPPKSKVVDTTQVDISFFPINDANKHKYETKSLFIRVKI